MAAQTGERMRVMAATGWPAVEMAKQHGFYFGGKNWSHMDVIETLVLVKDSALQYAGRIVGRCEVDPRCPAPSGEVAARIRIFNNLRRDHEQEPLGHPSVLLDLEPMTIPDLPLGTRLVGRGPFTLSHRYFADLKAFKAAFEDR